MPRKMKVFGLKGLPGKDGTAYYEQANEPTSAKIGDLWLDTADDTGDRFVSSASVDDTGLVSYKNAAGVTLFTLDLAGLGGNVFFGNVVISSDSIEVTEGGTAIFTVCLETGPSVNQPVYLAVNDNTRLSVSPSTLTFTPDNYATPQTVTVTAMQDDDESDDSVTVTLTSRKVDARQVMVVIGDDDKPQLVTDGLVLHFDYRGHQDDTSTTITDLVGGVTANNFNKFGKSENGIYGMGTYSYLKMTMSDEAGLAFINAMKNGQGFTTETFGTFSANDFFFGGVLHAYGSDGGISTGGVLPVYNQTCVPRILTDNTPVETAINMDKNVTIDGIDYDTGQMANKFRIPNTNNFIHVVTTFSPDGTILRWINGVPFKNPYIVENFQSWDYDAMFPLSDSYHPALRNSYAYTDGTHYMSAHRIYNRVLTEDEIKMNMRVEASKMGLTTF